MRTGGAGSTPRAGNKGRRRSLATLTIRLLGTLVLEREGQQLGRFPSKRAKDLLSYLLLNRDTIHPRHHLAGLFWSDLDDRQARRSLNTALWRLNQVLAETGRRDHPYLRVDAETIGFNTASDFRLDVAEFESLCMLAREVGDQSDEQQATLYRRAVQLYGGDLLVDCYEDWCAFERERLAQLHHSALSHLVSYHSARGEYEDAIDYALQTLALDVLREEAQRDLIGLYLASGQPAAALRQYRTCEDLLHRELAVDPLPETQALLPRILEATGPFMPRERSLGALKAVSRPSEVAQSLADALATMRQAVVTFETAYAQFMEASEQVAEVAATMGCDPIGVEVLEGIGVRREAVPAPELSHSRASRASHLTEAHTA